VDGMTKEMYGEQLEQRLADLHSRLRAMRWRHQPIRRVHIPKGKGQTRPIGISTIEDKIVQGALSEVLGAVYEPIFHDGSYGFRPRRGAHDALKALNRVLYKGEANWILEADLQSFFDSIPRKMLMEKLRDRVVDGSLLRLIGKCLRAGILDGAEFSELKRGAVQGSALSPLLGNVCLHVVLDEWFDNEVRPRLKGKALLVRFADDFVITFEREDDAKRVLGALNRRFERFGLTLHPEKTRLLPHGRPWKTDDKGPPPFDFLGFTHYWARSRRGNWAPRVKTRKWLNRRSQRSRLNWDRFNDLLRDFPLPAPRVRVQLWSPP